MNLRLSFSILVPTSAFVVWMGLTPSSARQLPPNYHPPLGSWAHPAKPLSALAALGKAIFTDKDMSNPKGLACVSCHSPETGFSYPISAVNALFGTVPGAVKGTAGFRRPPSIAYAPYMTTGVPHWDKTAQAYVGGMFWDGRATDTRSQVTVPLYNPVEMNNTVKGKPSPELVAKKLHSGIVSWRFKQVFGQDVFTKPPKVVVDLAAQAIVAYEKSDEVSPFTSKYDAYLEGKATLSPEELVGMRFVTGTINGRPGGIPFRRSAHCTDCHMLSTNLMDAPDLWTASCYANLGVPRNSFDLNYLEAKAKTHGKAKFKPDFGLGDFLYPHMGLPAGDLAQGDPLHIDGLFKAPTLRNVDKRPYPGFVKCYMHNGVFKSLKQVVHFYFTRNATSYPREVIDFRKKNPYANLRGHPFWAPPEYPDPNTLVNPTGASSSSKARIPSTGTGDLDSEQIGDLRLGPAQEDAIVAFLKALSDGYYVRDAKPTVRQAPHPVAPRSN